MDLKVVFLFLLAFLIPGIHCVTFTIKNSCGYTIWPAIQTNKDRPAITDTGFELASGAPKDVEAPANWGGRMWARTGCSDNGGFKCETANCGSGDVACNGAGGVPPASLVEFTLGDGGKDNYDISLVDGFNLPVSIEPRGSNCRPRSCAADVNAQCPPNFEQKGANGATVACKSACTAFGTPQYCCSRENSTPEKCPETDYSRLTKGICPDAYSYAFDDKSSLVGDCPTGSGYLITFCPK